MSPATRKQVTNNTFKLYKGALTMTSAQKSNIIHKWNSFRREGSKLLLFDVWCPAGDMTCKIVVNEVARIRDNK